MRSNAGLAIAAVVGIVLTSLTGVTPGKQRPAPDDLVGTWQWITSRNVKTGEVDSVIKHQVAWVSYTKSHAFYLFMEKGRPSVSPADFAKLSPAEQMKARYNSIWGDKGQPLFGGWASSYTMKGDTLSYAREISENPGSVGQPYREILVRVDRSTVVFRSIPVSGGAVREETWHRLD
jgi:hypothetical protein